MKIRQRLDQVAEFADAMLPFVMYFGGLLFVADATWQFAYLPEISDFPRALIGLTGLLLWVAGGMARKERKRAMELERELDRKDLDEETFATVHELVLRGLDSMRGQDCGNVVTREYAEAYDNFVNASDSPTRIGDLPGAGPGRMKYVEPRTTSGLFSADLRNRPS